MENFQSKREEYHKCRIAEKVKIKERLKKEGYTIKRGWGHGYYKYTSNKKLSLPYDLSNWMWIEAQKDGLVYFISFQAFDKNPHGQDYRVLFDRLGYCVYKEGKVSYFNDMITTEIELPVDEEKLDHLMEILNKQEKIWMGNNFIKVKEEYKEYRETQAKEICSILELNGYIYLRGEGIKEKSVSNWIWMEMEKDNLNYMISLQAYDTDERSGNRHVLMDRIGIAVYKSYDAESVCRNMEVTDIELPVKEEEIKQIIQCLEQAKENYKRMEK